MESYLDHRINIQELYKYQTEKKEDESNTKEYGKYLKYMNIYFQKDSKKQKYDKKYENGKFILIDKTNPKKIIEITPAEFVDIQNWVNECKKISNEVFYKISQFIDTKENITDATREEFSTLKKKFSNATNYLKQLTAIHSSFYKEYFELTSKKIEKSNEIIIQYQKRKQLYKEINGMIPERAKKELIDIFHKKKNKIPGDHEINQISKKIGVPSNETEKWFQWIESSYIYMAISKDLEELNNSAEMIEKKYNENTKYMMIKKPIVEEISK